MADPSAPQMYLLGRFEVRAGRRSIVDHTWRRRKAKALLKLLALRVGHQLHRDQIIEAVWPDLDAAAGLNNLHKALHHLRTALDSSALVAVDGDFVRLAPDVWVDVDAFRRAAERARQVGSEAGLYLQALGLYVGDLLPDDLYESWADHDREDLRALRNGLLCELSKLQAASGELEQAADCLQDVLRSDPVREDAHRALMQLYASLGSRDRALLQYQQCREVLRRELDAAPSEETARVYSEILADRFARAPGALQVERVRRTGSGRSPAWVRTLGVAVFLAAVGGGSLFTVVDLLDDDDDSIHSITFHHVGGVADGQLIGDCVTRDMAFTGTYHGDVTGDIVGTVTAQGTSTVFAADKCLAGVATAGGVIADREGNTIAYRWQAPFRANVATDVSSELSVDAPIELVGGTGAYEGVTGHGRCTTLTATSIDPGGSFTSHWVADCQVKLRNR